MSALARVALGTLRPASLCARLALRPVIPHTRSLATAFSRGLIQGPKKAPSSVPVYLHQQQCGMAFYLPKSAEALLAGHHDRASKEEVTIVAHCDTANFLDTDILYGINGAMVQRRETPEEDAYYKKEIPQRLEQLNQTENLVVVDKTHAKFEECFALDEQLFEPNHAGDSPVSLFKEVLIREGMLTPESNWIRHSESDPPHDYQRAFLNAELHRLGVSKENRGILLGVFDSSRGGSPDDFYIANLGLHVGPTDPDAHPELEGRSLMIIEYPNYPQRRREGLRDILYALENGVIPTFIKDQKTGGKGIFEGMADIIVCDVPDKDDPSQHTPIAITQKSSRSKPDVSLQSLDICEAFGVPNTPDKSTAVVLEVLPEFTEDIYHLDLGAQIKYHKGKPTIYIARFAYTEDSLAKFDAAFKGNPHVDVVDVPKSEGLAQSVNFIKVDQDAGQTEDVAWVPHTGESIIDDLEKKGTRVHRLRQPLDQAGGGGARCGFLVGTRHNTPLSVAKFKQMNREMADADPNVVRLDDHLFDLVEAFQKREGPITKFYPRGTYGQDIDI